jgi:sarcosine oxidase
MRALVIGAGAWGAAAASALARAGVATTLLEAGNTAAPLSGSSSGGTRIWRLAHADCERVRLGRQAVDAWRRVERDAGDTVLVTRGILWRDADDGVEAVASALAKEGVAHSTVAPSDVARHLPSLRPDARSAIFQPEAGVVLAAAAMRAHVRLFQAAGGTLLTGTRVESVRVQGDGVVAETHSGGRHAADVCVLAPGTGIQRLLAPLLADAGLPPLAFGPRVQQVAHFEAARSAPAAADWPCWFDGPTVDDAGRPTSSLYAMPGIVESGYKIGLDDPVRPLADGDADRTPCPTALAALSARVAACLPALSSTPHAPHVCTWTDSADGRFVMDRIGDRVVAVGGCCGEGFKFSALIGQIAADLALGKPVDDDVASFGLARFAGGGGDVVKRHMLGR